MSLSTIATRAEPSLLRVLTTLESRITRRHKSDDAETRKTAQRPGYMRKKGDREYTPLLRQRQDRIFTAFPENSLNHPLFKKRKVESNDLSTSLFEPTALKLPFIVGKPVEFSPNDPCHFFGLPKKMIMEFQLLSKPVTVVRGVTTEAINMLEAAREESSLNKRIVLTGRSGCGKSFLLLQVVKHCAAANWIVIYIPRAVNLVNSTTLYVYDIRTQTYVQPMLAFQIIQRMFSVNHELFQSVKLQEDLVLEKRSFSAGESLFVVMRFAVGAKARRISQSPVVLEAVMRTLEKQTEYPVLFAVDDFQSLYHKTKYRDPHFIPIQPYHVSTPRLIMEFASGKRTFAKGAFMGAINSSDPMFTLPLELRDALKLDYDHPMSPYDKRSPLLLEYAQGLKALPVPEKLTLEEASSLMSIWKNENVLVGANYDEQLLAKYTESGGNPRDFVWKGILSSFTSLECPLPELRPPTLLFEPPLAAPMWRPVNAKKANPGSGQHPW